MSEPTARNPRLRSGTLEERFLSRTDRSAGAHACWTWIGIIGSPGGYGVFNIGKRATHVYAHRWAYEHWVGPIPEGLEIDHICHDPFVCQPAKPSECPHRRCVNPAHLEAVTHQVNVQRGDTNWGRYHRRKTHCKQGHPYDEANTRYYTRPDGGVGRSCRACMREFVRQHRLRKKAQNRTN